MQTFARQSIRDHWEILLEKEKRVRWEKREGEGRREPSRSLRVWSGWIELLSFAMFVTWQSSTDMTVQCSTEMVNHDHNFATEVRKIKAKPMTAVGEAVLVVPAVVQANNTAQSITAQRFRQSKESIGLWASRNKEYIIGRGESFGRDLIESSFQWESISRMTGEWHPLAPMEKPEGRDERESCGGFQESSHLEALRLKTRSHSQSLKR
jgi:hypothetical protein